MLLQLGLGTAAWFSASTKSSGLMARSSGRTPRWVASSAIISVWRSGRPSSMLSYFSRAERSAAQPSAPGPAGRMGSSKGAARARLSAAARRPARPRGLDQAFGRAFHCMTPRRGPVQLVVEAASSRPPARPADCLHQAPLGEAMHSRRSRLCPRLARVDGQAQAMCVASQSRAGQAATSVRRHGLAPRSCSAPGPSAQRPGSARPATSCSTPRQRLRAGGLPDRRSTGRRARPMRTAGPGPCPWARFLQPPIRCPALHAQAPVGSWSEPPPLSVSTSGRSLSDERSS